MEKLDIGYGKLSGNVYLGRRRFGKPNEWAEKKRNITNEFIQVMLQKFEPNTVQNISVNGENKYRVIVVDIDRVVTVDGKSV